MLQITPHALSRAIKNDYERMRWARETRLSTLRELAGSHYGEEADKVQRPVNLIQQAFHTLKPALLLESAGNAVSARRLELRAEAQWLTSTLDQLDEEIDTEEI